MKDEESTTMVAKSAEPFCLVRPMLEMLLELCTCTALEMGGQLMPLPCFRGAVLIRHFCAEVLSWIADKTSAYKCVIACRMAAVMDDWNWM